jgi:phosphoglycerate dehydrogenase-like enzyme
MELLKVYTDIKAAPEWLDWLRQEIHPHQLLVPSQPGESVLAEAPEDPLLREADILLGQPGAASVLGAPKVRWAQISSAGFTRYDTAGFRAAAAEKGLIVSNSSHVYDQTCAEHAFAFMLAQARQLPLALASRCPNGTPEWLDLRSRGQSLQGQTVLIAGYGAIAERLVRFLAPFEMDVQALRRKPRGDELVPLVPPESLLSFLETADHVVNLLPDNPQSRGFFGAPEFAAMKPGSAFYNIGRGTTVDQEALADALQNGPLAAAWLDVTEPEPLEDEHPLRQLANCHITPHTAGGHAGETQHLLRHFVSNFRRFLDGKPLVNRVI